MAKQGRPPLYTGEQITKISESVFASMRMGISLGKACVIAEVPKQTFLDWVSKNETLSGYYEKARMAMMDHWSEEIIDIAEEDATYVDQNGVQKIDGANVQQKRLRIDSRKWLLSKLKPNQYGERVVQEHVGAGGGPINIQNLNLKNLSDKELTQMELLMEKASKKEDK